MPNLRWRFLPECGRWDVTANGEWVAYPRASEEACRKALERIAERFCVLRIVSRRGTICTDGMQSTN